MTTPGIGFSEGGKKDSEVRNKWGIWAINQRASGGKHRVGRVHIGSMGWLPGKTCGCQQYMSDPQEGRGKRGDTLHIEILHQVAPIPVFQ